MKKILLSLIFITIISGTKNNSQNQLQKFTGVFYASSPRIEQGYYYVFEKDQFHVFTRHDKKSFSNIYAARFLYFREGNKIYACNRTALVCKNKSDYKLRYKILSIENKANRQIVKLETKYLDSPLILEKDLD